MSAAALSALASAAALRPDAAAHAAVSTAAGIDPFFNFNPVCPASDGVFRVGQRAALGLAGADNIENYRPLINDVLIRVRTELCVLESFSRETALPFIREKGLGWVLPLHETSETYLAGVVFMVGANFILLGSTKVVAILAIYHDLSVGLVCRGAGGLLGMATPEADAETREREATDAFLRHTLTRIGDAQGANPAPASAVFASHPLVVAAAARVVGAYAPWLGQAAGRGDPEGVARGCAAYLLAALQAPKAFGHASGAFHALCAQCADAFARNRDTVGGLLDAAERALPESPPAGDGDGPAGGGAFGGGGVDGDDDRAGVVEGLARVVAAVADPREAAVYAKRLTAPIMARAARHAARAKATGEIPSALAAELKLLASALRFLEFPGFDAARWPAA